MNHITWTQMHSLHPKGGKKMDNHQIEGSVEINHDRRRFLGAIAAAIAVVLAVLVPLDMRLLRRRVLGD